MNKEEAISELQACVDGWEKWVPKNGSMADKHREAVKMALSTLRPITIEQAEKVWRGEWEQMIDPYGRLEGFLCRCGSQSYSADNFCPSCGMAMNDEAVKLIMERLEALKDAE